MNHDPLHQYAMRLQGTDKMGQTQGQAIYMRLMRVRIAVLWPEHASPAAECKLNEHALQSMATII